MAMTRQERISIHKKQERLQVSSGVPSVDELKEGVPVLRSVPEGVVEYVRYHGVLHKKVFDRVGSKEKRNTNIIPYGSGSAAAVDAYMHAPGFAIFTSSKGYVMHKAGSILSHSTQVTITTATSGDVTFEVRVNDANQLPLENKFLSTLSTGEKSSYVSVDFGKVIFSAGDKISVKAIETGTMAWDETIGYFEIEFSS